MRIFISEKDNIVLTIEQDVCPRINPRDDFEQCWMGTMICFHERYRLGDDHGFTSPEDFIGWLVWHYMDLDFSLYTINELKNGRWENEGFELKEDEKGTFLYFRDGEHLNTYTEDDITTLILPFLRDLSLDAQLNLIKEKVIILPLYLYEHGGITMSTTPFHCSWDSGQVGWIYCSKERFLKETRYSAEELFEQGKAVEILESEVEVCDQYLRGDIYGFTLEKKTTCPYCNAVEFEEIDSCSGFYGDDFAENGMADALGEFAYMLNFCKLITV